MENQSMTEAAEGTSMDAQTSKAKLELKNITKIFGEKSEEVVAVKDLNLSVAEGEMVTLLGPSGCGKTTTLRMVAGFEQVTRGTMLIDGADVTGVAPNARPTGLVFQNYALFPHMTVRQNLAYGLKFNKNLGSDERKSKVNRIATMLGLTDKLDRYPSQMSGGQQQRVALGRAMVVEPRVLLFDEPLSNLDAQLRDQMRQEIREVQKRSRLTSLYVTHDQSEAMAISDRVVIMNKGKVEQVGRPLDVYSMPNSKFVASFIGRASFLDLEARAVETGRATLRVFDLDLDVSVSGTFNSVKQGTLVIRPEAVRIEEAKGSDADGQITQATYLGSSVEYQIDTPLGRVLASVPSSVGQGLLSAGDRVKLRLESGGLHFLPNSAGQD